MLSVLSLDYENQAVTQLIQAEDMDSERIEVRINPSMHSRLNLPKKSMKTIMQDIKTPILQVAQVPGDTRFFWVLNIADEEYYEIKATLKIVGPHSLIYSNLTETQAPMASLIEMNETFETEIFPKLTEFFGSTPDIDSNNRIIILVFDIIDPYTGGNYVAGYFDPRHQYTDEEYSEEADILNIDKNAINGFETVAHEFQHMIHFGQDPNENIWLDEGASMFAEFLVGEDPFSSGSYREEFSSNPDVSLTYWGSDNDLVMANYGASYAFFLYLAEHYGGSSIIQDIVTHSEKGARSIELALNSEGFPVEFNEVFRNWTIANFLDDFSFANGAYGYYNTSLSMDYENSYSAESIHRKKNSVPYWGTDYLVFTDRTGLPFTLEFQGDYSSDFMVTAILTNTTPYNTEVIPIEISADEFGNFSIETRGISADEIVIAVSAYTSLGKNDHSDEGQAPAQDYWFMINPKGIIISPGNLTFSTTESSLHVWNIQVSDQNGAYWQKADGATYNILTNSGELTGINGNLTFNSETNFWESTSIDISELEAGNDTYRLKYHFFNSSYSGIAYSETFEIIQGLETLSSSSTDSTDSTPFPGFILIISVLTISFLSINRKKK
jgi:hypothetical protein